MDIRIDKDGRSYIEVPDENVELILKKDGMYVYRVFLEEDDDVSGVFGTESITDDRSGI